MLTLMFFNAAYPQLFHNEDNDGDDEEEKEDKEEDASTISINNFIFHFQHTEVAHFMLILL